MLSPTVLVSNQKIFSKIREIFLHVWINKRSIIFRRIEMIRFDTYLCTYNSWGHDERTIQLSEVGRVNPQLINTDRECNVLINYGNYSECTKGISPFYLDMWIISLDTISDKQDSQLLTEKGVVVVKLYKILHIKYWVTLD